MVNSTPKRDSQIQNTIKKIVKIVLDKVMKNKGVPLFEEVPLLENLWYIDLFVSKIIIWTGGKINILYLGRACWVNGLWESNLTHSYE